MLELVCQQVDRAGQPLGNGNGDGYACQQNDAAKGKMLYEQMAGAGIIGFHLLCYIHIEPQRFASQADGKALRARPPR